MSPETARSVENTAALYGVEAVWVDIDGQRRSAPVDVVIEVLRRLGAPVDREGDLADAARIRRREIWARVCPPARAVTRGEASSIPLRLPSDDAHGALDWRLRGEGRGLRSGATRVESLPLAGGSTVDGRRYDVRSLPLPTDLPTGRYELTIRHGPSAWKLHLVVAPRRTYRSGRLDGAWGVFHPLYGLRDERAAGVGDLATLREALAWTADRGGRLFGTTPLLAGFPDPPVDPSPYAPASRLFWDDRFVELEAAPGANAARAAGQLTAWEALADRRDDTRVPWDDLTRTRASVLTTLARRFFSTAGDRDPDFRRWMVARPEAADFARFMAGRAAWGRDWRRWPEPARSGRVPAGSVDGALVRRHLFGQWLAARQVEELAGAGAELYLDIPLGTHPDGYDVWRHRELFVEGVSAGAPPDDFFRGGQDWGLPPLHPERIRELGFGYVADVLRHAMGPAALVRLDHVMQLHRLFWVPRGAGPADGVYVRYPADELAAVVAVESERARCEVAGEDLGTVPDAVRELMDRWGIRRTAVLGFEIDRVADLEEVSGAEGGLFDAGRGVPDGAVATIETHDMVPLAGLREGFDLDEREALGLLEAREAERLRERRAAAFTRLDEHFGVDEAVPGRPDPLLGPLLIALGGSAAGIVLAPLDDLFGVREPQNVPGTRDERPNWRRRLPHPLALGLPSAGEEALAALAGVRGRTGVSEPVPDTGVVS
jgi:4-alpha-glucanotransferase